MATVSMPTPASTASVAHVCRHSVIEVQAAPARRHADLILRAMASGDRVTKYGAVYESLLDGNTLETGTFGSEGAWAVVGEG